MNKLHQDGGWSSDHPAESRHHRVQKSVEMYREGEQLRAGIPKHRGEPRPWAEAGGRRPGGGPPQRHGEQAHPGHATGHGGGRGR